MIKKIVFEDKINVREKSTHKEELRAEDVNHIKEAINTNADDLIQTKKSLEFHKKTKEIHITKSEREKWNTIKSETSFKDEEGTFKYLSDIDKRTGYYDNTNKVYYPDIKTYKTSSGKKVYGDGTSIGGNVLNDGFFELTPKDASFSNATRPSRNGIDYYCLKFPNIPKGHFSFELDIQGIFIGNTYSYRDYCRVKVNSSGVTINTYNNMSLWNNTKMEFISNSSDIDWEFYLVDDIDGNVIIAFKQKKRTYSYSMNVRLCNLTLNNVWGEKINPLDFYTGWEGFSFNTYRGLDNFRIRKTFALSSSGDKGISVLNKDGALLKVVKEIQIGENLNFNPSTNELSAMANFYEEGTVSNTLSAFNGYFEPHTKTTYERVGNSVHLKVRIEDINTAYSGSFTIINMPFPVAETSTASISYFTGSNLTQEQLNDLSARAEMKLGISSINFITRTDGNDIKSIRFTNGIVELSVTYRTNIYTYKI